MMKKQPDEKVSNDRDALKSDQVCYPIMLCACNLGVDSCII